MFYRVKHPGGTVAYNKIFKQNVRYFSRLTEKGQNEEVYTICSRHELLPYGTLGLFLRETTLYRDRDTTRTIECYELLVGEEKILVPTYHLEVVSDTYLKELAEKAEEEHESEQET